MSRDNFFSCLSESQAAHLRRAGFGSAMDLLLHFPRRHEDWQNNTPVSNFQNGTVVLAEGEIVDVRIIPIRRRGRHLLASLKNDENQQINLRFFHVTQPLRSSLFVGRRLRARGVVRLTRNGWEMAHPKLQSLNVTAAMETIYPAVKGITPKRLRELIAKALSTTDLSPTAPPCDDFAGGGWTVQQALTAVHTPLSTADESFPPEEHPAWRRLRFEELLAHQLVLRWSYYYRLSGAPPLTPPAGWDDKFNAALPFSLTKAQQRTCEEITADLAMTRPMRRLLQGDVGSGKTVVAAYACLLAIKCGYTAAVMAPTEILAEQHYLAFSKLYESARVSCELLTGDVRGKRRIEALRRLQFGISSMVVGTHALFQEDINLPRLAVTVVDEQHRFGVTQRRAFANKGAGSHRLMMSATPIPRTLAMSMFSDMDVSVLDEKPAGRKPVKTVLADRARRLDVLARVAAHVDGGGRAYWVCPFIEESETAETADVQTLAAEAEAAYPQMGVRLLHGRMKPAEKNTVMDDFRAGKFGLLVATTVVEVGVDVPQADVMVIEGGERMGLSQLHQLRGRVGRGERDGVCVILYQSPLSEVSQRRLSIIRDTEDGFEIARQDLALRGPGEWLGGRQSGLPLLRVARLLEDDDITAAARRVAEEMLKHDKRLCVRHVRRWLGGRLSLLAAGVRQRKQETNNQ